LLSLKDPLQPDLRILADVPAVMDRYKDAGPLGGLASATAQVRTPLVFAAAGDLANIEADIIDELVAHYKAERARGVPPDAVIPRHKNGRLEPLAALYDTKALHANAVRTLESGRKKVTDVLQGLRVAYYEIIPDRAALYHNVNTVADLSGVMAR
jgi:molybdopterin-guanine dinucleotide biosynthesis protein A